MGDKVIERQISGNRSIGSKTSRDKTREDNLVGDKIKEGKVNGDKMKGDKEREENRVGKVNGDKMRGDKLREYNLIENKMKESNAIGDNAWKTRSMMANHRAPETYNRGKTAGNSTRGTQAARHMIRR